MKKTLLLSIATCVVLASPGPGARADADSQEPDKKEVTAFKVSWRCPAALQIGCGSHAKPILMELEENPAVSEAWLNRQGTVMAVVWKSNAERKARKEAEKLLKAEKASRLRGKELAKAIKEFESKHGWYRGAEVDRLSEEEAGIIATRWVRRLQTKSTLSEERAEGLRATLTEELKKYLTGKAAMPESEEAQMLELRRIASPFLDEEQLAMLKEAVGCGMRAMPNEE